MDTVLAVFFIFYFLQNEYEYISNFLVKDTSLTDLCNCPDIHRGKNVVLSEKTVNVMQSSMSVFNMAFLQVNRKDTIRQRKVSEKEKSQCVWKLLLTALIKIKLTVIRAAHTSGQMSFVPFPSRPLSQRHAASQTQASTCNVIHKYTLFPQTHYKQYTHFFHTHKISFF